MPRFRLLFLAAVAVATLAGASDSFAAPATRSSAVDLVAGPDGIFAPRAPTPHFTLAGVSWRGPGYVAFRTRSADGRWSAWRPAAPESEDAPDTTSREWRGGRRIGNPWWTGLADAIEARARGRVSTVRAHLVWSPESFIPYRQPAAAEQPAIVARASWGANESIRRGTPSYASALRLAIVHHTAGRNDYSRTEAPAIVRAIQLYHVRGNGWNDIGYNFLVDRFGTVYEGRFGGVERNVVGAHAQGFNTGSVGIALLGTYGSGRPSAAAEEALAGLLAWRLDLAHLDPTGAVSFISGGNERFPAGTPVTLAAVSGHRDTGSTECPGDALYARLATLAVSARAGGGTKIFDPLAEASGTLVRFQARLSRPQPWTVGIAARPAGSEVARGVGTGDTVDWTWDSAGAPAGSYAWTISAGAARPASGVVRAGGGSLPLDLESVAVVPDAISPNGDGQADSAFLTYRLTTAANVTVEITDEAGGIVATVVDRVWTRAGDHELEIRADSLVDGRYGVVVTARTAAGAAVQEAVPLTVSRTLGAVEVLPAAFSPNEDGRNDRLHVRFTLAATALVRIRMLREGRWVATPWIGSLAPGSHLHTWNGLRSSGALRDGAYEAVVEATDELGTVSYATPFAVDTIAPRVRILPARSLRLEVSEPALLVLRVDGRVLRREVRRSGIVRILWSGPATRVRVVAWDAAGNRSEPVVRVRRGG